MQHTALRRKLTARLETAFGRPVQVGSYGFSLWRGPAIEARSVTVGEGGSAAAIGPCACGASKWIRDESISSAPTKNFPLHSLPSMGQSNR